MKKAILIGVGSLCLASSVLQAQTKPNDPYYTYQAAISESASEEMLAVSSAWDLVTDASPVVIAVIDTGADLSHPDLVENLWINANEIPDNGVDDDHNGYVDDVNGYDFRHEDSTPEDEWGHGSIVAGIVGAVGNNGIGTAGVAWNAQLMILKVFGSSGGGKVSDFVEAIRYAIDNGAQIINASWTVPQLNPGEQIPALRASIEEAEEAGVLVVAAAGNDAENLDDSPVFPAAYPNDNVISVAGLQTGSTELLPASNYSESRTTVAVSGESVLGPYRNHSYASLTGTSAATGVVTGVAALMLSKNRFLSPAQIKAIMVETTDVTEDLEGLVGSGGVLNPYKSLVEVERATSLLGTQSNTTGEENDTESSQEAAAASNALSAPVTGGCSLVF